MKKIIFIALLISLAAWIFSAETTTAHGSGTVLINQIGQDARVRFEYEATQISEGESIPLSVEVLAGEEEQEIEWVFIRIINELNQATWSGNLKPEDLIPKIVRMVARFDEQGRYSINLKIKIKNQDEIIRTVFDIEVLPQQNSFIARWGNNLRMLVGGILIGTFIGASIWRRKNT